MVKENGLKTPDFFIVGAAKSGTTSLWYYLGQKPELFLTSTIESKELGYFCNNYGLDRLEEYCFHFREASNNQMIGEVCHAYLSSPESAKLIHDHNPNAKIIIVLRNPIERAFSLYNWMVQHGYENLSFKKAVEREKTILKIPNTIKSNNRHPYFRNYLYANTGLYYEQVKLYHDIFSRQNLLVLFSEDLKLKTKETMQKIFNFLGTKNGDGISDFSNKNVINHSYRAGLRYFLASTIGAKIKKMPYIHRFSHHYFKVVDKLTQKNEILEMNIKTRKHLISFYQRDIDKLQTLLNRDLSKWLS